MDKLICDNCGNITPYVIIEFIDFDDVKHDLYLCEKCDSLFNEIKDDVVSLTEAIFLKQTDYWKKFKGDS